MEDNSNRNSKIKEISEHDTDIDGKTQISEGKLNDGTYELSQPINIKPLKTGYATT